MIPSNTLVLIVRSSHHAIDGHFATTISASCHQDRTCLCGCGMRRVGLMNELILQTGEIGWLPTAWLRPLGEAQPQKEIDEVLSL